MRGWRSGPEQRGTASHSHHRLVRLGKLAAHDPDSLFLYLKRFMLVNGVANDRINYRRRVVRLTHRPDAGHHPSSVPDHPDGG